MKLQSVLNEYMALTYRSLSPKQVNMINKIAAGRLDMDSEDLDFATLDSLQDLGLLDATYELTETGQKAARIGQKLGSMDRRGAARRDSLLGRKGGMPQRYTDDPEGDDVEADEGGFTDKWQEVKDRDDV